MVGGADADLIEGDTLVEIKTTKTAVIAAKAFGIGVVIATHR